MIHTPHPYNPFETHAALWQITCHLPYKAVMFFAEQLSDTACTLSYFEVEGSYSFESKPDDLWAIQFTSTAHPDAADLQARLSLLASAYGIEPPSFTVESLPEADWVSQVQSQFPPMHIGRYYVHGQHVPPLLPGLGISLTIDAGRAFGTGEHETTSGCLKALDMLRKKHRFTHMLDMGCGSGILAIACAKTWKKPVTAIDIDPHAAVITRENAVLNHVPHLIRAAGGNGYHCPLVRDNGPYDLIVSNILANPLIRLAPQLASHLKPSGIAVLSGFLGYQVERVLRAHQAQGLRLITQIVHTPWHVLVLEKR